MGGSYQLREQHGPDHRDEGRASTLRAGDREKAEGGDLGLSRTCISEGGRAGEYRASS